MSTVKSDDEKNCYQQEALLKLFTSVSAVATTQSYDRVMQMIAAARFELFVLSSATAQENGHLQVIDKILVQLGKEARKVVRATETISMDLSVLKLRAGFVAVVENVFPDTVFKFDEGRLMALPFSERVELFSILFNLVNFLASNTLSTLISVNLGSQNDNNVVSVNFNGPCPSRRLFREWEGAEIRVRCRKVVKDSGQHYSLTLTKKNV